ncbi:MAG: hypothetical protein K6C05_08695 [Anaerovibrio sp.]|uniref:hypothetical protein n=1 Tax=Anaerovibrio sp. TaxID=1872532 RepID=UPI0025F2BCD1|nr:hypothetical protein [Anaerovibrio sp.]MCR5176909.1 hypothetical protein [Anaerovibrio sp.]
MVKTNSLLSELIEKNDLKTFLEEHQEDFINISPSDYLKSLADKYDISMAEIARTANLGDYIYKIFRGERKASRDILICICLAIKVSLEELQLLLRLSQYYTLDVKNERDAVILYGIKNKSSLLEINNMLYELKLDLLIGERDH